jgi:excinuclease ABC subunit C
MAYRNIYEYAYKSHLDSLSTKNFTKKTMQNLLEILRYKQINKDIIFECNDISHLSGNYTVASRSVIENGKTNPSKYRKLKIKTLKEQEINDFDSMREVIIRRLKEIGTTGFLPDLIIID